MNRALTTRKKILFASSSGLLLFFFLALLVEAGMRIRQWIKYGTTSSVVANYVVDKNTGLRIPVPNSNTGRIRINSLGFRSPELADPKPPASIRLAFLGSSTTFCAEASGNETTWPHLVWNKLQSAYPDVKFEYINAGVPGYTTTESLANLESRVKPLHPDVIVIYEATNDLSYDTRELAKKQGLYQGRAEEQSWLAGISVTWFLVEKNLMVLARQREAAAGQHRLVFDPGKLSQGFRDRLTKLVLASREVAPVVAVATFSTKFRRTQPKEEQLKAANTALYYMPYMSMDGLLNGFEAYNAVIRDVAEKTRAILVDGEFEIPGDDTHFNDSVHFKDPGSQIMSQRVANALLQSGQLRALVKKAGSSKR